IGIFAARLDFIRLPHLNDGELYELLRRIVPDTFDRSNTQDTHSLMKKYLQSETLEPDSPFVVEVKAVSEQVQDVRLPVPDDFLSLNSFTVQRVTLALSEIGYELVSGKPGNQDENTHTFPQSITLVQTPTASPLKDDPSLAKLLDASLYKFCPPRQ